MQVALRIAYDGKEFHGFQRQENASTVQGVLEEAVGEVNGGGTTIRAAGRTDAGVHAFGQIACFWPRVRVPMDRWPMALNRLLPNGIWVHEARAVPADFHPIRSAICKHYRYRIRRDYTGMPFLGNFAWHLVEPLDIERMQRTLELLRGKCDFGAFQVSGRPVASTVRTMYHAGLREDKRGLSIDFVADGFLYKMVRSIVGTLVEVGRGRMGRSEVESAMRARDRSLMGPTAPPHGLYLVSVHYPTPSRGIIDEG